jgi:Holliday junction resolvase-like predicted endonuclease
MSTSTAPADDTSVLDRADKYLSDRGYTVVDRVTLSIYPGDALIARDPDHTVVIVEVQHFGIGPVLNESRVADIHRIVREWVADHPDMAGADTRYDVLDIVPREIAHYEGIC